ncbi:MAG: hypothetical protein R3E84_21515 [Pseudomonadales bacterium]
MTKFKKILLGSASLVLVAAAWAADLGASKSARVSSASVRMAM